jgi:hypothetical protein
MRDKLVASAPAPNTVIAYAFGADGIAQSVPCAGLDNLLADLTAGTLEGIVMLQAKPPMIGTASTSSSANTTPSSPRGRAGATAPTPLPSSTTTAAADPFPLRYEVEFVYPPGTFRLRLGGGATAAGTTGTAAGTSSSAVNKSMLLAAKDELNGAAKRVIAAIETSRRVRVTSAVFEFAAATKKDGRVLHVLVGVRDFSTSASPDEAALATFNVTVDRARRTAAAAAAAAADNYDDTNNAGEILTIPSITAYDGGGGGV